MLKFQNFVFEISEGHTQEFPFRLNHCQQFFDDILIQGHLFLMNLAENRFPELFLSPAIFKAVGNYYTGYHKDSPNQVAYEHFDHFAPPCGNKFCCQLNYTAPGGLFISTIGGAA
jgi:hypothetical protein